MTQSQIQSAFEETSQFREFMMDDCEIILKKSDVNFGFGMTEGLVQPNLDEIIENN